MFSKRENDLIMVYNVHTAGAVNGKNVIYKQLNPRIKDP